MHRSPDVRQLIERYLLTTEYTAEDLPLSSLLLDPNNFRFSDDDDRTPVSPSRFHEPKVQQNAWEHLKDDGILDLKKSILSNGFLPVERIVVRPYEVEGAQAGYVVLEGNRRTAALKWIEKDHENGTTAPDEVVEVFDRVPVIVVTSEEDESAYLAIMGVRHVGGIKEWGGYQSAKLVAELKDEHQLDTNGISSRLGLSAMEVNRRYRAFKALGQMRMDEEFGERASAQQYALFFEAISGTRIKEWLKWDDATSAFLDTENRRIFYSLIAGVDGSDTNPEQEPKITRYLEVRELRLILDNEAAYQILLDPERSFSDASAEVKAAAVAHSWRAAVRNVAAALESVGAREMQLITDADVTTFQGIVDLIELIIKTSETARAAAGPSPSGDE